MKLLEYCVFIVCSVFDYLVIFVGITHSFKLESCCWIRKRRRIIKKQDILRAIEKNVSIQILNEIKCFDDVKEND